MADTFQYRGNSSGSSGRKFDYGKAGITGLAALNEYQTGINALSTSRFNAKQARQEGKSEFRTIIGDMHQAIGEYISGQGASGVRSNSAADVVSAAASKGAKAAATAKYNKAIEAINYEAAGRAEKLKVETGVATTFLKSYGGTY